jgi:hypothetical protein
MAANELFQLIKSMTKSERRYFQLRAQYQDGIKNYLKLFKALDSLEEYDEKKLQKKLSGEKFIRYLSYEKHYLNEQLLNSLRGFHRDDTPSSQAKYFLLDVEVLFEKGLYAQCEKRIQLCLQHCRKYELFQAEIEALDWLTRVYAVTVGKQNYAEEVARLHAEKQACIEKLQEFFKYQRLDHVIYTARIRHMNSLGKEELRNEELEALVQPGYKEPSATRARSIYFSCAANYSELSGNVERALLYRWKFVESVEKDMGKLVNISQYIHGLNNITVTALSINRYEDVSRALNLLSAIPQKHPEANSLISRSKIFSRIAVPGLQLLCKTGNTHSFDAILSTVETRLKTYEEFIEPSRIVEINLQLAIYSLCAGQFKHALDRINQVLNNRNKHISNEYYAIAQLVNLLIHYELGNHFTLEPLVKSAYRYLSKSSLMHEFERELLKFLGKVMSRNFEDAQMQKMYAELAERLEDLGNKGSSFVRPSFDFLTWVKSKVNNIPFPDMIRAKASGSPPYEKDLLGMLTA